MLKRGTLEAYLKWLVTNKRKSGDLNYSKAITFGMPAGRGRKGERPPRSRRGRQSASLVVQRNPSSSIVANQSQKYPDGAQLHDLYPAPGQPSVAAHQIQLGSLCPTVYNPPAFLSTEHVFLMHTRHHFKFTRKAFLPKLHPLIGHFRHSNYRQQQEHGTQVCRRIRITSWHCQQMLKSVTNAVTCSQKNFVRHHTTSWSSMWIGVWYAGTTTQGR